MKLSIITPAHNEEQWIGNCASSVAVSARECSLDVEHIVVLNRCDDRTAAIARSFGCRIVHENECNLSRIRNAGVAVATGEIIVTMDADSIMSPNMLGEVVRRLATGRYIGGEVSVRPERWSLGIVCSLMIVLPYLIWHRVSAGMFWCRKHDFDAIGGFDESLPCIEDLDFGKRLRALGKKRGLRYGTIRNARITTSCRKFDQHGDWIFVRNPGLVRDLFRRNKAAADAFYYNARTHRPKR